MPARGRDGTDRSDHSRAEHQTLLDSQDESEVHARHVANRGDAGFQRSLAGLDHLQVVEHSGLAEGRDNRIIGAVTESQMDVAVDEARKDRVSGHIDLHGALPQVRGEPGSFADIGDVSPVVDQNRGIRHWLRPSSVNYCAIDQKCRHGGRG